MELRAVVWAWETVIVRLRQEDAALGDPLGRSCRPLAAERQLDGQLLVVLGCWWPADLAELDEPLARERLEDALGNMLEDVITCQLVPWPAGFAEPSDWNPQDIPPPSLLGRLPEPLRIEAGRCESPLQRWLYTRACMRGLRLQCQYVVGHLRLDFALPRYRLAVEVAGWEPRPQPRHREQQLGAERWRLVWFAGREVHDDVDRCVSTLLRGLPRDAVEPPPRPRPAAPRLPRPPRRAGSRRLP